MTEQDYSAVPSEEDGGDSIPTSFYGGKKPYKTWFPRSYNFRRRASVGLIACVFLVAGILASLGLGKSRGHIKGGAKSFLGNAVTPDPAVASNAKKGMSAMVAAGRKLAVTTWNVAAINNNPFEYWITYTQEDNAENYNKLMVDVQNFIEDPGDKDVPVHEVFTDKMFAELDEQLTSVAGWTSVKSYWEEDFRNRKIVSQFMKDGLLGKKRLASMPDRVTNTIHVDDSDTPVCRPTVINQYSEDLSSLEKWWADWQHFMFKRTVKVGGEDKIPYTMLKKINRIKYKAVSEKEEEDSLPLQTMCAAIFDAILVHMMNTVSPPEVWQQIKNTLVENLNKKKISVTLQILEEAYVEADIITLQEVASSFINTARNSNLGEKFHIITPKNIDSSRDQNSVICLNKRTFPGGASSEVKVEDAFSTEEKPPVEAGDVLVITATNADGLPMVIASFHGDTNGLATKPVLDAIMKTMNDDPQLISHKLVFGLDANTYENASSDQQSVVDWGKHYQKYGLTSCWGDKPQPSNHTTYNARTYLQPQLNKACRKDELRQKGDVNPKDFILFGKQDFKVLQTWKDNTGRKVYLEETTFPTLDFPSDHGLLSTIIEPKGSVSRK